MARAQVEEAERLRALVRTQECELESVRAERDVARHERAEAIQHRDELLDQLYRVGRERDRRPAGSSYPREHIVAESVLRRQIFGSLPYLLISVLSLISLGYLVY